MKKNRKDILNYFNEQFIKRGFFTPSDINFIIYDKKTWETVKKILRQSKVVVDLGCGGGTFLYNVSQVTKAKLIGVDLSKEALLLTSKKVPTAKLLQADVCHTSLKKEICDFCSCMMVVEHIEDEENLIREVKRILKKDGYFFLTTILRKGRAWYFYKNKNGERVLEPTHLREYSSENEILEIIKNNGFEIIWIKTPKIFFPLIDPLIKIFFRFKSKFWKIFLEGKIIETLRLKTKVPIPGYYSIEIIAKKK